MQTEPSPNVLSGYLLRVINPSNVCVLLSGSAAIVHAELKAPLSPRSHLNSQAVHAFAPCPMSIALGPYDMSQHRFTECALEPQLPETKYTRVKYGLGRKKDL
jgi:hypothetical protein